MDFRGFDDAAANNTADIPASQHAATAVSPFQQDADLTASARDLKLPPFCATDAISWFQRAEINFRMRGLRNEVSKMDHVLSALPEDSFPLISSWLAEQGETLTYNKVKTKILSLFAPTPEIRAARIIQLSKLKVGTQRASAAYMEMKALSRLPDTPDGTGERHLDILRALWLQRLPAAVRGGITKFMELPEDKILDLADSLQGSTEASDDTQVCSAQKQDSDPANEEVAAVPFAQQRRNKTPAKKRDSSTTKDICYYHARFRKEAHNCRPPCIFAKNE